MLEVYVNLLQPIGKKCFELIHFWVSVKVPGIVKWLPGNCDEI